MTFKIVTVIPGTESSFSSSLSTQLPLALMKGLYVIRGRINPRKTINNKHLCLPKFIIQCTMRTYLIMKESTHNGYVCPSLTPCISPPAFHNWLPYYKMQITIADKTFPPSENLTYACKLCICLRSNRQTVWPSAKFQNVNSRSTSIPKLFRFVGFSN